MSRDHLWTISNRWIVASVSFTLGFALLVAIGGFVVLPYTQTDLQLRNVWDAICSAAGVPRSQSTAAPVQATFKTSDVIVMTSGLEGRGSVSIGRGATLALRCAICHGASGAAGTDVPVIAGQDASVVYKQLEDFKSGARANAAMGPFAAALSEHDILDLTAYYSQLPNASERRAVSDEAMPPIVARGAPMRNIAQCEACHDGSDGPRLTGQPAHYLKTQLEAFHEGIRHNDISQRMRNVARGMTSSEIDAAVRYYQNPDPNPHFSKD